MRRKKPDLSRFPIVVVENECITNVVRGGTTPPRGEDWEMYLFVFRQRGKNLVRDLVTVRGETKEQMQERLLVLLETTGAKLIDKHGTELNT